MGIDVSGGTRNVRCLQRIPRQHETHRNSPRMTHSNLNQTARLPRVIIETIIQRG